MKSEGDCADFRNRPRLCYYRFWLIEGERGQYKMVTYGAITTSAGLPLSKRLYQIDRNMEELIGQLKPDAISIEELFFNTNITTGYRSGPWTGRTSLRRRAVRSAIV